MKLKKLADLRDFCFVSTMKFRGEEFAEREYKFQLEILCGGYYVAFSAFIGILLYKFGIPVPLILKGNIMVQLIVGLVWIIPYHFLFKYLFLKMSKFPIDKDMEPPKFKALMRKVILLYLLSIALMVLIPWSLDRLLPPFY